MISKQLKKQIQLKYEDLEYLEFEAYLKEHSFKAMLGEDGEKLIMTIDEAYVVTHLKEKD